MESMDVLICIGLSKAAVTCSWRSRIVSKKVSMKFKVLIVDDEPLARRGIRLRLKAYSDFVILDDCEDGMSAIEAIEKHAPDLVFLDIQMRGITGFEVLNHIPKHRTPFIIF